MRQLIGLALLVLVVGPAHADRIELGGFAGYNEPYDQDDASDDIVAGARMRVPLGGFVKVEPMLTWFNMDRGPYRTRNVIQEISTWQIFSATLNVTLGRDFGRRGYHPYVTAGVGYYLLRKEETDDQNRPGLNAGAGLMVLMAPDISLDLSGRAERITLEGGGSRGMLNLRIGLSYHLGDYR